MRFNKLPLLIIPHSQPFFKQKDLRANLRLEGARYNCDFAVLFVATDVRRSVTFSLAEHGILVRGDKGDEMFEVSLIFTDDGECQLIVNEKHLESCQVRRMALEELLFQGH